MMMMIDLMKVVAAAVVGTVMVGVWAMEEAVMAGAGPTGQQPTTVAACTGPRQGFGWAGFQ